MTAEDFKQEAEALQPTLSSLAQGYLHSKEDAEDIVQDVLMKLWAMLAELHSPMAPLARTLTRNICIDHIRRHRPLLEIDSSPSTSDKIRKIKETQASVYQQQNEIIERMMLVIGQLPPKQQLVLRLRHISKMSFTEIAQLTGDSEANIRQILCRARQGVRKKYMKAASDNNK